ncbi:MAG: MlaD family protein [Chitinophagaceae bacterium]
MSKEARIGLLVAVSILVFFVGFYFLKGSNIFSGVYTYHALYDNVQGLQPSATVQIHGLKVGKVSDILLNEKQLDGKVDVVIEISKKTRLPKGTIAKLTSLDLLGNKGISLELGNSNDQIDDGAQLPTTVEGGLLDNLSVEVTPLLKDVRKMVNSIDSVLNGVNEILSPQARADLQNSIAALHTTMESFKSLAGKLNAQGDAVERVVQNADKITSNLAKNNDNIDKTLNNLKNTTDKLAQAPIQEAIKKVDDVAANLNEIVQKINHNEGSMGLLINDKALYQNLTKTASDLGNLSADLKAHPWRYINITIFGRKARVGD